MKSIARPLAVCTVVALSLGSVVATSSAASAVEPSVDFATLDALLASSIDATLTQDLSSDSASLNLVEGGHAVLDLAGHNLTVTGASDKAGIEVPVGAHLTIKDSVGGGVLTSTGSGSSAGIGRSSSTTENDVDRGLIEIISGEVIAESGTEYGAGIGGAGWNAGPAVTISGGTVTARSHQAAGIGAGYNRSSGAISISGGDVTAYAGSDSTAIGAPIAGHNTSTVISGGTVTLHGSNESVLGAAYNYDHEHPEWFFGEVSITGGTVVITKGSFLDIPTTKTVVNSGTIINDGSIEGLGTLDNRGTVVGDLVTSKVSGRDYLVSFDALGGSTAAGSLSIRARSFSDAGRTLAQPEHETLPFTGWNTKANGTGATVDLTTDLEPIYGSASSAPVAATLFAMYGATPRIDTESLPGTIRGQLYHQELAGESVSTLDYSISAGALPRGVTLDADGTIHGVPTAAGTFDFTVLAHNEGGSTARDFSIDVQREAKKLAIALPKAPTAVGSKVTVPVSGLDAGERFTISTGAKTLATGIANAKGKASVSLIVPKLADGKRSITVVGSTTTRSGTSTLTVVAATKKFSVSTNKKNYHYGQKATITVKGLAAGEKVSISFRGKTITSSKAVASSKGTYTVTYSVGSTKGTKTIKVTGAAKTRAGSASIKVKK